MNPRPPLTPAEAASRREERREAAAFVVLALPLLLALFFAVFVCYRLFSIPSTSMAPALPVGSYVVASRLSYGFTRHTFDWFDLDISTRWPEGEIKRGDIVVFRKSHDRQTCFVKRIIGLGGDRVAVRGGRLIINGETVQRHDAGSVADPLDDHRSVPSYIETLPGGAHYKVIEAQGDTGYFDETPEFVVPPNALFMMGDNRDNSADSRDMTESGVGFVPVDYVVGKVVLRL